MQSSESTSDDAIGAVQAAIKDAGDAMKGNFGAWSIGLKKSCESLCSELQVSGVNSAGAVSSKHPRFEMKLTLFLRSRRLSRQWLAC